MRTEFPHQDPGPSPHPCNAPDLSPIEFLRAVYQDPTLPMATRIAAAKALLPFTEPRPASIPSPHCTIVIPPLPNDHGSVAQDPASVHRILQSSSVGAEHSHQPLSGDESQSNIETTFHPLFFDAPSCIEDHLETTFANAPKALLEKLKAEALSNPNPDYSTPPTPQELAEIKAAINKLRPDLAHLPIPEFHLCPCGHWITGEYDCCRALSSRDPSKMN